MKLFGGSNFIETYSNSLTKKECEILINQFEKSRQYEGISLYTSGKDGEDSHPKPVLDRSIKSCKQLADLNLNDGSIISRIIYPALIKGSKKYYEKYPALNNISGWRYDNHYSFQKYYREDDGYKSWHCEHGIGTPRRVMAWMFYLNNAKSGTEFRNHPTIQGERGSLSIWPAFWTHVHRGVTPNKGLKYIITGWLSFTDTGCQDYGKDQSIVNIP